VSVRSCRVCGCTDEEACLYIWEDGEPHTCYWVEPDLCSECATPDAGDEPALLYDAYGVPVR
jgi:hypothetical protein